MLSTAYVLFYALVLAPLVLYFIWLNLWWREQFSYCNDLDVMEASIESIQAGDVLLSASVKPRWSFSWWRHAAVAFLDRDGVVRLADFTYGGLGVFDVDSFLKMASRTTVYAIRRRIYPLSSTESALLTDTVYSLKGRSFTSKYVRTWIRRTFVAETGNLDLNCASFVATCLMDASLIPRRSCNNIKVSEYQARYNLLPGYHKEILLDRRFFPAYNMRASNK